MGRGVNRTQIGRILDHFRMDIWMGAEDKGVCPKQDKGVCPMTTFVLSRSSGTYSDK